MKVLTVIATCGSLPYVHLQLEAHRRFGEGQPILVHDDWFDDATDIEGLCRDYGAFYRRTPHWYGAPWGDWEAIGFGIEWAREIGADWCVKRSRRFVTAGPWLTQFLEIAGRTRFPTLSSWCIRRGYGFLTTCVAFRVADWYGLGGTYRLRKQAGSWLYVHPETFVHDVARTVAVRLADPELEVLMAQQDADRRGYENWPFVADGDQHRFRPDRLWKDTHAPRDYAYLASDWGLPYREEDFVVDDRPYDLSYMYRDALQDQDIGEHLPYLRSLCQGKGRVVELGTGRCSSTLAILAGQPGQFIMCDLRQVDNVDRLARASGRTAFSFVHGNSLDLSPQACDVLFIDTEHTAEHLSRELACHGHLAEVIVLHDTETFGVRGSDGGAGLWQAVRSFCATYGYAIEDHRSTSHGLTTLRRRHRC